MNGRKGVWKRGAGRETGQTSSPPMISSLIMNPGKRCSATFLSYQPSLNLMKALEIHSKREHFSKNPMSRMSFFGIYLVKMQLKADYEYCIFHRTTIASTIYAVFWLSTSPPEISREDIKKTCRLSSNCTAGPR